MPASLWPKSPRRAAPRVLTLSGPMPRSTADRAAWRRARAEAERAAEARAATLGYYQEQMARRPSRAARRARAARLSRPRAPQRERPPSPRQRKRNGAPAALEPKAAASPRPPRAGAPAAADAKGGVGKARGTALAAGLSTAKITEIRRTSIIGHEDADDFDDALDAPRARTRTQAAGRRRPSDGGPVAAGLSTAKITELRSKFLSDVAKPRDNSPDRPASDHALSTSGGPPVGVSSAPEPPTHLRSLLKTGAAGSPSRPLGVADAPDVRAHRPPPGTQVAHPTRCLSHNYHANSAAARISAGV